MRHSSGTWSTFAFSSCRHRTSGCSFSMNSHTCAARARMPFTFQVAIFMKIIRGPWAPNNYVLGTELRAADDLQLVVDALDAFDLAGDLPGLGFLAVAGDGAPQTHAAVRGGDVDRAGG